MVTSHSRGHLIEYVNNRWVYADNGVPIENENRCCTRCHRLPTKEGFDACLGHVPGATSACCGHGVEEPYVVLANGQH